MADVAWEDLFDKAIACLDNFSNQIPSFVRWSLGGGTASMMYLSHRHSKDINIFTFAQFSIPLRGSRVDYRADHSGGNGPLGGRPQPAAGWSPGKSRRASGYLSRSYEKVCHRPSDVLY
jgi:hypothetical protein